MEIFYRYLLIVTNTLMVFFFHSCISTLKKGFVLLGFKRNTTTIKYSTKSNIIFRELCYPSELRFQVENCLFRIVGVKEKPLFFFDRTTMTPTVYEYQACLFRCTNFLLKFKNLLVRFVYLFEGWINVYPSVLFLDPHPVSYFYNGLVVILCCFQIIKVITTVNFTKQLVKLSRNKPKQYRQITKVLLWLYHINTILLIHTDHQE